MGDFYDRDGAEGYNAGAVFGQYEEHAVVPVDDLGVPKGLRGGVPEQLVRYVRMRTIGLLKDLELI